MLKITKVTDYGIDVLARISREGRLVSANDLSEASLLPLPIVSKVLKILAKGGILDSRRGAKGGYFLARPADEISVAEVIELFEGRIGLTECKIGPDGESRDCSRAGDCSVMGPWVAINEAIVDTLKNISMADMARKLVPSDVSSHSSSGSNGGKHRSETGSLSQGVRTKTHAGGNSR
jgi:FeS assembly SUF system regulator